jgi:hypothetical protein
MVVVLIRLADEALVDWWAVATFVVSLCVVLIAPRVRLG